jgi:hypothetical protein
VLKEFFTHTGDTPPERAEDEYDKLKKLFIEPLDWHCQLISLSQC